MNNDIFNHLMERLLSKADDALNTYQKDKSNEFYSGRVEAYYELFGTTTLINVDSIST